MRERTHHDLPRRRPLRGMRRSAVVAAAAAIGIAGLGAGTATVALAGPEGPYAHGRGDHAVEPVAAAPAPRGTVASGGGGHRLVALGDSWAAGTTAGVGIEVASGVCRRGIDGYPALVAPGQVGTDWTSRACAAATGPAEGQFDALAPDTRTVTASVGADATGLGTLAHDCGYAGAPGTCDTTAADFDRAADALPAELDRALGDLRARAGGAHVLVTGYPLLAEGATCATGASDPARARRLDDAVTRLDAALADRAGAAGMTFVDPRPAFAGHGVCSTQPWVAPFTLPDPVLAGGATRTGQEQGYQPTVNAALTTPAPVPSAPTATPNAPAPNAATPDAGTPDAGTPEAGTTTTPAAPGTPDPAVARTAVPSGLLAPLFGD